MTVNPYPKCKQSCAHVIRIFFHEVFQRSAPVSSPACSSSSSTLSPANHTHTNYIHLLLSLTYSMARSYSSNLSQPAPCLSIWQLHVAIYAHTRRSMHQWTWANRLPIHSSPFCSFNSGTAFLFRIMPSWCGLEYSTYRSYEIWQMNTHRYDHGV